MSSNENTQHRVVVEKTHNEIYAYPTSNFRIVGDRVLPTTKYFQLKIGLNKKVTMEQSQRVRVLSETGLDFIIRYNETEFRVEKASRILFFGK